MYYYSKRGIKKKHKALRSLTSRMGKTIGVAIFDVCVFLACLAGACGACAGVGVFMGVIATAPDIKNVDVTPAGYSTTVYDRDGKQITKLIAENSNRIYVTLDKIPEDLQHAFVAIEDERFYQHNGIDIQGIMRAGVTALTSGDLSQGASTITQQLLKNNVFLTWTSEASALDKFKRKFQEQYCAVQLEKVMDKDKILENYLNTINLGQGTLGVQAASQRYFGKPCSQLNISECAVIACITQNPSKWNPISHPENNAIRREEVLKKMRDQGYISEAQYAEAMADNVYERIQKVNQETEVNTIYSYFVDELVNQVMTDLQEQLGYSNTQAYNTLYSGGLSIFATQDPGIQSIADQEMENPDNYPENVKWYLKYQLTYQDESGEYVNFSSNNFEKYFKENRSSKFNSIYSSKEDAMADIETYKEAVKEPGYTFVSETVSLTPQPQTSITVMDQYTGEVLALVGGRGTKEASLTLNRATGTKRQPGSCFKVLAAYAPAIDSGEFTLASTQLDEPYTYANGRPVKNWYDGYKGVCTYRYGIEQSLNIIAVKAITAITPKVGFDMLLNFGFTTLVDKRTEWDGSVSSDITQSLALGGVTDGVTNMELTAAYATIANNGQYIKPRLYTKIVDHDGNDLLINDPKTRQVLKPTTAYCLTSAMEDVVKIGTGKRVDFGNMAIAGKTGTTSSNVDVWFSGYTPYYTCAAWAGYDNNVHMVSGETNTAKNVWKAVMGRIHENLEYKKFVQPDGIVTATVCNNTGKQMNTFCLPRTEIMDKDSVPKDMCMGHLFSTFTEEEGYSLGTMCSQTGKVATDTCPYATTGMVNPLGGYCMHSYMNGVPMFTPEDMMNQTANADILAAQAQEQAAAGAAKQAEMIANGELPETPAETPLDPMAAALAAMQQAAAQNGIPGIPQITPVDPNAAGQ
ncbi:MAG: PBP1A family penicillin-binding protein [Lachnospiraceae bacterium]|nr:PBP1A family penicillin-binding protein [Lachnospiraceae bacterium]